MSVMRYPCILCVVLVVLCVACLTGFTIFLGLVVMLFLNVMEVLCGWRCSIG